MLTSLLMLLFAPLAASCGSGGGSGATSEPPPPSVTAPQIASFSAAPVTVPQGQPVTLTWQVRDATALSIDNGVGTVTGTSVTVIPQATTLYTLTAQNAVGSTRAQAAVMVTIPSADADANAPFSISYRGTDLDPLSGSPLGGTEFRILVAHKGRLFGGLEGFLDDPPTGVARATARIVAKDSAAARWRIDRSFNELLPPGSLPPRGRPAIRHEGVTALASVTFQRDGNGRPLTTPTTVLVAGMRDFLKGLSIYVRNDAAGTWSETLVENLATTQSTVRSFGSHRDKITGADLLFVGGNPGGIYSASYDPVQGIRFRTPAELATTATSQETSTRPMAFAVCDGDLFSVIAPFVYRRIDGPAPRWEVVLDYSANFTPSLNGPSGLRGLTCVESSSGTGSSLIAGLEGPGMVFRLDRTGSTWILASMPEYDVNNALTTLSGRSVTYTVIANNTFTPFIDPDTLETVHLMTVQTRPALSDDAYYTIRGRDGRHRLLGIRSVLFAPPLKMRSTRTAIVSPFPEENGSILYIGGYDVVDDRSHNTAFVLRAGVRTVLQK